MNERMPACALKRDLGLCVAAGGGAERKQRWPVSAVTSDRDASPHDDAERIPQGVQALKGRVMGYIIRKASPSIWIFPDANRGQAGMPAYGEPSFKPDVGPFASRECRLLGHRVARIETPDQRRDDGGLVLLHQIPKRHVDRHAARLNARDGLAEYSTSASPARRRPAQLSCPISMAAQ